MVDTVPTIRVWLKPGERAVISTNGGRLVKLNDNGQPGTPPKPDDLFHRFELTPGRYSVSATVQLGSGLTAPDPEVGPQKVRFAAKGEWTGTLQTGVAMATLFEDASK